MHELKQKHSVDEEAYANAYYYFHEALEVLAKDAEAQCQEMGYFNVAWEAKDDAIKNGYAVLNIADGKLSAQQEDQLRELLENVAAIPDAVVNVPNSKAAHVLAMGDPCWDPIRAQAKRLLSLLETETNRVNTILRIKRS